MTGITPTKGKPGEDHEGLTYLVASLPLEVHPSDVDVVCDVALPTAHLADHASA